MPHRVVHGGPPGDASQALQAHPERGRAAVEEVEATQDGRLIHEGPEDDAADTSNGNKHTSHRNITAYMLPCGSMHRCIAS